MKAKKKISPQAHLFDATAVAPSPPDPAALERVTTLAAELARTIAALPLDAQVEALNRARLALHAVSPFGSEPVDCVLWFPEADVAKNDWNPNAVQKPEMVALTHSMQKYGITMSIVGMRRPDAPIRITDGFHRNVVIRTDPVVRDRVHGYLPLSLLKGEMSVLDEQSATILHNQARGQHSIVREMAIVRGMAEGGWTPEQIGVGTVKSREELVRIQQVGGAAQNLASGQYGKAWDF